jgi:hypothetical protein
MRIGEHTLPQVSELFDYLAEHPTTSEILSAVYKVKKPLRLRGQVSEDEFNQEFYSKDSMEMIGAVGPMENSDTEMKASMYFAKQKLDKIKYVH